jgi:ATP-dependent Clp protease ATP-binding subunit ClpC
MEYIVDLQMKEVQERLSEHNINRRSDCSCQGAGWPRKDIDSAFGARPLRRAIQKYVESPLSVELLSGKFKDGAIVLVDVDEEKNKLVFTPAQSVSKAKLPVDSEA